MTCSDIRGAYFVDIQLTNRCNKVIRFFLYAIDAFSKYTCVIPLKNKKGRRNQFTGQTKQWWTKIVSFTTGQQNHG